jgi:ABC-type Fe3+/spermidine/putrescine transport system ATPase subunit
MQRGSPEAIYGQPENMFVAEFIGDSTVLQGKVTDGGGVVLADTVIEGLPIHCPKGGSAETGDTVNIILRAADLRIYPEDFDGGSVTDALCLSAEVERSMFIGSEYKNLIRFHDQTIFADCEDDFAGKKIKLVIPKDKIRIFKD